jgi:hypothetical protein
MTPAKTFLIPFGFLLSLSALGVQALPLDGGAYTASVWRTDKATHNDSLSKAKSQPVPNGTTVAILDCYIGDGTAVVRLTHWPTQDKASSAAKINPSGAKRTLAFVPTSSHSKPGSPTQISNGMFVQWSEFLLKSPDSKIPLSNIINPMTNGMVISQPTLVLTRELHSLGNESIALLAVWKDRAGFDIFAKNKTFGDKPYWEPYAVNEHWMCQATVK